MGRNKGWHFWLSNARVNFYCRLKIKDIHRLTIFLMALSFLFMLPFGFAGDKLAAGRVYVDSVRGSNANAGLSWVFPKKSINGTAADPGALQVPGVTEIWVADSGTPHSTLTDHFPFIIPSNVKVYGGFTGTETDPTQRTGAGTRSGPW